MKSQINKIFKGLLFEFTEKFYAVHNFILKIKVVNSNTKK